MSEKNLLTPEEADEALQDNFKRKREAEANNTATVGKYFMPCKVSNGGKFKIRLKCTNCNNTVVAQNHRGTMERHMESKNCTPEGRKIMVCSLACLKFEIT